ncbi:hypothetical protein CH289_27365 [Rhodococcus sp. RS1C4]|nr:hypothetical protein CH289_27365 [Rhodococcus sp. RS1C4]
MHKWNSRRAVSAGFVLVPRHYSTDAVSLFATGGDGQAMINDQLVNDADIVISLFRHKLGSPTPRAVSGTAEEIETTLANGRRLHIFFSNDTPDLREQAARDQWDSLAKFKENLKGGLWDTFDSPTGLRELVGRAIEFDVNDHFTKTLPKAGTPTSSATAPTAASVFDFAFDTPESSVVTFDDYDIARDRYISNVIDEGMKELRRKRSGSDLIQFGSPSTLPSDAEWKSTLDEWADAVRESWRESVQYLAGWAFTPVRLSVEQLSDHFLKSVRIDLRFPGVRGAKPKVGREFDPRKFALQKPRLPGSTPLVSPPTYSFLKPGYDFSDLKPVGYPVEWENVGDEVVVTIELERLRPRTAWKSEPVDVVLLIPGAVDRESVEVVWTATAEGVNGLAEGTFSMPVRRKQVLTSLGLLTNRQQ